MNAQVKLVSNAPMTNERSHRARWYRHRQQQRSEIIRAAGNVFSECGYDRASMRMVAEMAELAKPNLYAYFRGKSVLLDAVVECWMAALPTPKLDYANGKTLRLHLTKASRELLRQARHPASIAFERMMARSSVVPEIHCERWRQRYSVHLDFLQRVLADRCYANDAALAASQFVLLTVGDATPELPVESDEHRAVAAIELFSRSSTCIDRSRGK